MISVRSILCPGQMLAERAVVALEGTQFQVTNPQRALINHSNVASQQMSV
jgi:hypothetical protein